MTVMSWMESRSGKRVELLNPDPEDLVLEDLVWSLSRQPRFLGHTNDRTRRTATTPEQSYSVAQHSVEVSRLVEVLGGALPEQFAALLHDSAEAYMGDITAPVKAALRELGAGNALRELEFRIEHAIGQRFQIDPGLFHCEIVKRADLGLLAMEHEAFFSRADWPPIEYSGPRFRLVPWHPELSYQNFLVRFNRLQTECLR